MARLKYIKGMHGPGSLYSRPGLTVRVGGEFDVADDDAASLVAGGCFERVEAPVKAPRTVVAKPQRKSVEALLRGGGLTEKQIGQIERAGLLNDGLAAVPDETLKALKRFGPGTIAKVRKALA
jgi:hypothetical protein